MAPTQNAAAVQSVKSDVQLVRRAAALIGSLEPRSKPELVVTELLAQLACEKVSRESRGLNHWDVHAPKFLGAAVRRSRLERRRRHQEAEAFYKAKRREALRFARVIVGDSPAAEAVTAETYRELLEGGTTSSLFFSALVGNARNYLEGQAKRNETFQPFEASGESAGDDVVRFSHEPVSHHFEDQDPLEILIAREDQEERDRQIEAARRIAQTDWRYCWIGQKKWGKELGISTARGAKS